MILTLNEYRGKLYMEKNLFCITENIQDSEHWNLLNNCEKVIYFLMEGLNDGQVYSINYI